MNPALLPTNNLPQPSLIDNLLNVIEFLSGIIMIIGITSLLPSIITGIFFLRKKSIKNKKEYKKIGTRLIILPIIITLIAFILKLSLFARSTYDPFMNSNF